MSCRPTCRRTVRNTLALSLLALGLAAAVPAAASNHGVCEGYDRKQRISRLGGRAAFTKTPVTSAENLKQQLDTHRAEVEALMASKGLGHLTDALYAAVAAGKVSERDLERGEVFEWMVYRKRSGPVAFGPMCVASKKTYDAFVVEVTEEESHPATAECALKVTGGACVGERFTIDTSGSSAGVKVDISGPGGSTNPPETPGTYRFTASAETQGSKTVTTHTFVVPKICLNLAYAGKATADEAGDIDSCQETASVEVPDCKPSCAIRVTPGEVSKKESVTVDVTGNWDAIEVEVTDPKSEPFAKLTDFPATVTPTKNGIYKLSGTATNAAGSASCTAEFTVAPKPRDSNWTARFFGVRIDPDEGPFNESRIRPNGVSERSHLHLDGGAGAGVELEYHFNPRIGLAASAIFANLESELFFDLDDEWESDEDDISFLSFLVGPNFHLTPDKKADVYLGLFVGLVDLGSTSYQVLGETQRRSFDADTVFGAQLGVDIPFGSKGWAVNLAARYLDMTVETGEEGPEVAADPLILQAGFAYKF